MLSLQKSRLLLLLILVACASSSCSPTLCPGDPEPLEPFCVPERVRVALVLGSGGVRGIAHVGVIEELVNANIPIDLIVGCSAGSIVGAVYADHPCIECLYFAIWDMRTESLLDFDLFNCRYGLCRGSSMTRVLDRNLNAVTFDELEIPLVVVASDLCTGELIPIGSGDLVKAVHASCSIPFIYTPREYLGRILVDGGVVNPVPVIVAKDIGADIVIAVDLCELLPKTMPCHLFHVATRSAEIAFMWQNEICTRQADVIIRPKTCGVGAFDDSMRWETYFAGKKQAREEIPRILALMKEKGIPEKPCTTSRTVSLEPYTPRICIEWEEDLLAESQAIEIDESGFRQLVPEPEHNL